MDAQQVANEWLAKINPNDPRMALNSYGQCQLVSHTGESCILFVPQPKSAEFHLFQDIVPLPSPCEASVYEEILKLNLPCEATRGGALALDARTRNLVFTYSREIGNTDIKVFCAVLENFLNAAQEIKKLVNTFMQVPADKGRAQKSSRNILLNRVSPSFSTNP